MAIVKSTRYPGRWETASSEYPMGKPKNRTSKTSEDGTYPEADWLSDQEAFLGAIMNEADESPNGTVDTAEDSQIFNALKSVIDGNLTSSTNGYQVLPSGLVIQWGGASIVATGTEVTFPLEFPNSALSVSVTDAGSSCYSTGVTSVTTTSATLWLRSITSASLTTGVAYWTAIGY